MVKMCGGPCKQVKPLSSFGWKNKAKGRRRSYCDECQKTYLRNHYQENKPYYKNKAKVRNKKTKDENYDKLYEYLRSHPCVECGEDEIILLEFDHISTVDKVDAVTELVRGAYSWAAVQKEIDKCRVLCLSCHRRRTAKQFKWRRANVK